MLRLLWFMYDKRPLLLPRVIVGSGVAIVGFAGQAARAQVPAAPTMRSLTATTGSVAISINAVSGATSYSVYRSTTSGGEGPTPLVSGLTSTNYTDTAIVNGTKYYYQITATNASGESAKSAEYSVVPLAQPVVTCVAGNNAVGLSWGAIPQATAYKIYRSTSTGTEVLVNSTASTSFTDMGLTNGTTYFYKVTAYLSTSTESAKSVEVSASPQASVLGAPVLGANTTATSVGLTWTSVSGATGYTISRGTTPGGPYTAIGAVTTTTYVDTPPLSNADYYYVVTATSGAVQSLNSNEVLANVTNGVTLTDIADTYVSQASPTTNFGQVASLTDNAATGANQISYITFDLTGTSGSITNAKLKLYKYSHNAAETVTVYGIAPNSWSELGTTWNTAPSLSGATVAATLAVGAGTGYYTCDVTSYLQAQKAAGATAVSFAITGNTTSVTGYYPRENYSNIPALTVLSTASSVATGLIASPGEQQVLLTWQPVQSATGYNVYRSTTSGSGYTKLTTIAPIVPNAYLDKGLTNGTAYYYIVKPIIAGAEGTQSAQASATPLAQDANWKVTPPSGFDNPAPATTANSVALSSASGSTLIASSNVFGATSTTSPVQVRETCSGTWTFTWVGSSWPTLYVVNHTKKQLYSATINDGNGTCTVANTGGSTLASATYPITGTELIASPVTTNGSNTADILAPVFSTSTANHVTGALSAPGTSSGPATGWSEINESRLSTQTAYTSQWFQSHFSSPANVVLTFVVPTSDVTVSSTLSSTASDANAAASALISDMFAAQ